LALPTFLGIGVPRGGTTWLHGLLETHPEIYMPSRRKEVRFFDAHLEKGTQWYEGFFCGPEERGMFRAIGEVSPQYIYCKECPRLISETLPGVRLILMLRHPVDRAYSQYGFLLQRRNFRGSFPEFLVSRPKALEYGYYSRYVKGFLEYFSRSHLLPLVSEEAFADVPGTCRQLGAFLDVPADGFELVSAATTVNRSTIPRARRLAGVGVSAGRRLRRLGLEPVVDAARRAGVQRVFHGAAVQRLDPALKAELSRAYSEEFDELESLLEVDLSSWRTGGS
jgi:Sulfotransferase domain